MNILIIQAAKLGDMVCTTPMFRAVKKAYPDAKLLVMGSGINKEVLAGNPYVDEYIVLPNSRRELTAILREKKIDFAAMTSTTPYILLSLLLARVGRIAVPVIRGGFSPYQTKLYRLLSLTATRVPMSFGEYVPRAYLRLLGPLGIHSEDTKKDVYVSDDARKKIGQLLAASDGKTLIGIAPGVGNKIKAWGGSRFAEVAQSLSKKYGATIVLIGGSRDKEEVESMRTALKEDIPLLDFSEKLSLEELKALISRLRLFISVDTGPIYIAEALGIPTLDIVGPMDESEQPPRGTIHRVVVPPGRKEPVTHIFNSSMVDTAEARRQAELITPAMVLKEADALML